MQIQVIKEIVGAYSIDELQKAEAALLDERQPEINIEGEDEGEQLTHILAAIWIKDHMDKTGESLNKSVRAYSVKVRTSIS